MSDTGPILQSCVEQGVLVLTILREQIEGEETAAILKQELLDTVEKTGIRRIVLDLGKTQYVSSIAFWPLLTLRRLLLPQGGRLLLCGLIGAVYEVFTTTKMISNTGEPNAPFEMAPDRETAIARLATATPAS